MNLSHPRLLYGLAIWGILCAVCFISIGGAVLYQWSRAAPEKAVLLPVPVAMQDVMIQAVQGGAAWEIKIIVPNREKFGPPAPPPKLTKKQ